MQLAQVEPGLRTGFLLWAPYECGRRPGSTTQCGRFDWDNVLNCIVPAKAIGIKDSLMRLFCFVLFLWGTALAPAEDHAANISPGRKDVESLAAGEEMTLQAQHQAEQGSAKVKTANLFFDPVRYRPMAAKVTGLKESAVSLDGAWRIDPNPDQDSRAKSLTAASWGNFQAPGQWAQQGYEIPRDKTVALVREFAIPAEWAGYRIFLRFDAIHGGTHYWLNGNSLGYNENLFTPLELGTTAA